jgi:hypothetical protein
VESVPIYGAGGRRSWSGWTKAVYAGPVVGALVFSVSTQALAVCLHKDVVLFIVTGTVSLQDKWLDDDARAQCGAAGAELRGNPGGEDECIQHVVERGSKLLGIKGYCLQDRRVLLRCGHREGAESGGLGDLWIGDSDVNKKIL